MSLLSANAVPLPDVLPWADVLPPNRTVLINDSVGTDGRFLLHTLASQTLRGGGGGSGGSSSAGSSFRRVSPTDSSAAASSAPPSSSSAPGGRVLWLGCTPASVKQIASALKKIGCDASLTTAASLATSMAASSSTTANNRRLEIVPIMLEAATEILSSSADDEDREDGENDAAFANNEYLKKLYKRIKAWLSESSSQKQPHLIVVDDATSLATIFGPTHTEFFVRQVRSLILRQGNASMAVLCSTDADQDQYLTAAAEEGGANVNVAGGGSAKSTWLGAGSDVHALEQEYQQVVGGGAGSNWERNLVELADGIVDVMPLQSGFSLEAHGRLVFTERKGGRGWRDATAPAASGRRLPSTAARPTSSAPAFLTTVVNYCCEENSIKAFRLRSSAS